METRDESAAGGHADGGAADELRRLRGEAARIGVVLQLIGSTLQSEPDRVVFDGQHVPPEYRGERVFDRHDIDLERLAVLLERIRTLKTTASAA
jgi:hypothetical protein